MYPPLSSVCMLLALSALFRAAQVIDVDETQPDAALTCVSYEGAGAYTAFYTPMPEPTSTATSSSTTSTVSTSIQVRAYCPSPTRHHHYKPCSTANAMIEVL